MTRRCDEEMTKKRLLIVLPRLLFFFTCCALSTQAPYMTPWYDAHGYSALQIGLFIAIDPVVNTLLAGVWGAGADRSRKHALVLALAVALVIGCTVAARWSVSSLWGLVANLVFLAASKAGLWALVNAVVAILCANFGRVRLYGSIGWGCGGLFAGFIVRSFGLATFFYIFPPLYAVVLVLAIAIHFATPVKETLGASSGSYSAAKEPFSKKLRALLSRWAMVSLLVCASFIGFAQAQMNFYYLLLRAKFPSLDSDIFVLTGVGMALAVVSEIPVFFFATKIMDRISEDGLLLVALASAVLRLAATALLPHPWVYPFIELALNGPMYAGVQASGTRLAAKNSPQGLEATAQALFHITFSGIGMGTGNAVGGWLFRAFGPTIPYWTGSIVSAIMLFLWLVNLIVCRRMRQQRQGNEAVPLEADSTPDTPTVETGDAAILAPRDDSGDSNKESFFERELLAE